MHSFSLCRGKSANSLSSTTFFTAEDSYAASTSANLICLALLSQKKGCFAICSSFAQAKISGKTWQRSCYIQWQKEILPTYVRTVILEWRYAQRCPVLSKSAPSSFFWSMRYTLETKVVTFLANMLRNGIEGPTVELGIFFQPFFRAQQFLCFVGFFKAIFWADLSVFMCWGRPCENLSCAFSVRATRNNGLATRKLWGGGCSVGCFVAFCCEM